MNKKILACLLLVGMISGLTGCGENVIQNAAEKVLQMEPDASFALGATYSDSQISITPELAVLSEDGAMTLMTKAEDGSISAYASEDKEDALYLDCISTVKNTGEDSIDLQEDLLFYGLKDETLYNECIILMENADGTDMEDGGTLKSGESARVHYAIMLPTDLTDADIELRFMMPESGEIYNASLQKLLPKATDLTKDQAVKRDDGISLTLKSADITESINAVSEAGGGYSLHPQTDGNQMIDAVLEITNDSKQDAALGTLYRGLMLREHVMEPAIIVMETNQDMTYSGTIKAGSTVTTHLTFELSEQHQKTDPIYVYFNGQYFRIPLEK